ncbi:MAG: SemiSWEET family transporter [Candidatus Pacebacteria bacterium]|nr:SemiSWEET family transporter [Candidatus Paceibacterota bacterium]
MQYIFYLPAILFLISGVPQIYKLIKTKSSNDISLSMYLLTWVAVGIVVVDTSLHHDFGSAISNFVSLVTMSITIFLVIRYRNIKKPPVV